MQHDRPQKIKSIGKLRGLVREMLKEELCEINALVEEMLKPRGHERG